MALKHISLPYTLQGVKIPLTVKQEETCKALYKNVENDLYEFAGFYDPEIPDEDYPDGLIALSVKSVLRDVRYLAQNTGVWNVDGSSGDPWYKNMHPNWIQIWEDELIARGYQHARKCYVRNSAGITCNTPLCGGHMVLTNNTSPAYGSDNTVYIIPICNAHNNWRNTNRMNVSEGVWALVLDKYHQVG